MAGVIDRFVRTADGVRIFVRDYGGSGPALVVIHGFFGNLAEADTLGPLLTDHYRVVAYDQRGHGWSESGDITIPTCVDDFRSVIGALGLDTPVLFAGSFGTLIALAALQDGVRARGFVNMDGHIADWPADGPGPPPRPDGPRILSENDSQAYLDRWARSGPDGVATGLRTMQTLSDGRIELRPSQTELNTKALAFSTLPILDCYRSIEVPVLVLDAARADADEQAARDVALDRLRTICSCEVRQFKTGHWISAEDPDGVADALTRFATLL